MKILFVIIVFITSQATFGQLLNPPDHSQDKMPEYPGGINAIHKIIKDSLIYPKIAFQNKVQIQGEVSVQFLVDTMGNPTNLTIIKSISPEFDAEAIRVVSLLKGWTPGIYLGKKTAVKYVLPINFTYPEH